MPFYEYQCGRCGHHHEELQKVAARPLLKCPGCGRNALRRLVSAPVFRLKGGGWYETDFKADKGNQRNLAGDKEPAAEKQAAEKPEAEKPEAEKPKDARPESAAKGEPPTAVPAKPKAEAVKPAATRKRTTRRRARK